MNIINPLTQLASVLPADTNIDIPKTGLSSNGKITELLNYSFGVLAAISFLVIVIAGVQFILSSGEPQKINTARNAIIYAAVGLAVSLLAMVIVSFVLAKV